MGCKNRIFTAKYTVLANPTHAALLGRETSSKLEQESARDAPEIKRESATHPRHELPRCAGRQPLPHALLLGLLRWGRGPSDGCEARLCSGLLSFLDMGQHWHRAGEKVGEAAGRNSVRISSLQMLHTHTQTRTHAHTYSRTHILSHTHTHSHTQAHTHTRAHVGHARAPSSSCAWSTSSKWACRSRSLWPARTGGRRGTRRPPSRKSPACWRW